MEKIDKLKKIFKRENIDSYIVPKNDEFFSEYIPDHNDRLNFISNFSGSAGSCVGPINISKATTHAACYVAMKHVFDEIPANAGAMVPINVVIPEDSILAATAPKPVGGYTETILRLIDLVFQAMSEAAPQ